MARIGNPGFATSQRDRVFGVVLWAWLIFSAVWVVLKGSWLWYVCAPIDLLIAVPQLVQCLLDIAWQRPTLSDESFGQR
jgi:hypothetical protein